MKTNHSRFKRSALNNALLGALALYASCASANTELTGRITDAQNKVYFEGAQIKITELNLSTVSQRDGSFRFNNLPAGEYTIVISYVGVPDVRKKITVTNDKTHHQNYSLTSNSNSIENVIVFGQRAGQAGALSRQKNANRVISVVSADAIGQLPDQNATEALQRLPGLSIQRDQGEGRFVAIRGIDPNLNNVTINGLNVPSPEAGVRSVALDVIPSEVIASLEVSKTVTPDMDASAIGGSIEVKSLSAFDREGQYYSVNIQNSYNALVGKNSPKVSGSYSQVFTLDNGYELGVAGALSWFNRQFASDNIETDGGWSTIEVEDAASGEDVEIFGAEEIEQRQYRIERERLGAAINLDLHTSTTDKYYLRSFYSEFSDDEYRQRKQFKFDKGTLDLSTHSPTHAQYQNAEMERDTKDRFEQQEILSLVAGGENQLDTWLVEYQLGYSKSNESEPDRLDVVFVGEALALGYNTSGSVPQLNQTMDAHDLTQFALDEIVAERNLSEDQETSIRLDISKDFVWHNYNSIFKFGGKLSSREKFNDVNAQIYDGGFNDATAQDFATAPVEFNLGDFGPGLSRTGIQNFVHNSRNNFDVNTLESDIESQGNSYTSSEDILALYAMLTIDIDQWQVVTGLRYEETDFATHGNKVELVIDEIADNESVLINPWAVDKSDRHLLPSINIKYSANDKLISRFAYTQTIARPTFSDSAAFQLIETEVTEDNGVTETERKAEVGNPELEPYESQNIDFSVEYYPAHIGILSAGLFHKDIKNYIVKQEVQTQSQWDGYEEVMQSVNGGSASLTGIELAWNKSFDSGLLLGANGTFVNADSQLPNQSDTVGNLMVGFENNHYSLRLSASHKSKTYQFDDNDTAVYQDAHTQFDFSSQYNLSDNIHLFFNAVNLSDEPLYLYHGTQQYNYQYEEYGRTFEFGLSISSM